MSMAYAPEGVSCFQPMKTTHKPEDTETEAEVVSALCQVSESEGPWLSVETAQNLGRYFAEVASCQ